MVITRFFFYNRLPDYFLSTGNLLPITFAKTRKKGYKLLIKLLNISYPIFDKLYETQIFKYLGYIFYKPTFSFLLKVTSASEDLL